MDLYQSHLNSSGNPPPLHPSRRQTVSQLGKRRLVSKKPVLYVFKESTGNSNWVVSHSPRLALCAYLGKKSFNLFNPERVVSLQSPEDTQPRCGLE